MKLKVSLLLCVAYCGLTLPQAQASLMPVFSTEESGWLAKNVIVVTEKAPFDGNCTVVESWMGDLQPGTNLNIPELSHFATEQSRTIPNGFRLINKNAPAFVSGERLLLFLKTPLPGSTRWRPTSEYGLKFDIVWLEPTDSYAEGQIDDSKNDIVPLRRSEAHLKNDVKELDVDRHALTQALTLRNVKQRALALGAVSYSHHYYPALTALEDFTQCGPGALPVLRLLLADDTLLPQHSHIIEAMAKIGGKSVGPDLVGVIETESRFRQQLKLGAGPKIRQKWQESDEDGLVMEHHAYLVMAALSGLQRMDYRNSKSAVEKLLAVLKSPSKPGNAFSAWGDDDAPELIENCNALLKLLADPKAVKSIR